MMGKYVIFRKVMTKDNIEVSEGLDQSQEFMQTGKEYDDLEIAKQWASDNSTLYVIRGRREAKETK